MNNILFHYDVEFVHFVSEAASICEVNARKCFAGLAFFWQTSRYCCEILYLFLFKKILTVLGKDYDLLATSALPLCETVKLE